jgi:ElaB/YqjD/DUF883 family membrane-anchored ribosome-binding protein
MTLRIELDALRREIEALRRDRAEETRSAVDQTRHGVEKQLAEIDNLVKSMLDEAEETVAEHPVASVAGALALGILIGRLTAH